jgi:hypothetical protein
MKKSMKSIESGPNNMKYRCVFCCKDSEEIPCQKCGNDHTLYVKGEKHTCQWSRRTISSMECKVCDRVISNKDYFSGNIKDI